MLKPTLRHWLLLAALIVVLDQISKWIVFYSITPYSYIPVMPLFNLTHVYNKGAAWSFLADAGGWQRWFFTALALAATVFITVMLKKHLHDKRLCLGLTLILGGAVGNVIDRMIHGHVIDFIDFYWGLWHFPAFNVADISITLGAMVMIWDSLRSPSNKATAPSADGR